MMAWHNAADCAIEEEVGLHCMQSIDPFARSLSFTFYYMDMCVESSGQIAYVVYANERAMLKERIQKERICISESILCLGVSFGVSSRSNKSDFILL